MKKHNNNNAYFMCMKNSGYFKDKKYYINKIKEYLGLTVTALLFDAFVIAIILINAH